MDIIQTDMKQAKRANYEEVTYELLNINKRKQSAKKVQSARPPPTRTLQLSVQERFGALQKSHSSPALLRGQGHISNHPGTCLECLHCRYTADLKQGTLSAPLECRKSSQRKRKKSRKNMDKSSTVASENATRVQIRLGLLSSKEHDSKFIHPIISKGSRLGNLFQTLEKLNIQKQSSRLGPEDLQSLRYTTSKIQLYVATQERLELLIRGFIRNKEKAHRDHILKSSGYLDLLLSTFESCYDSATQQNIVAILSELLGKSHTGKKASTLVAHGATHALFVVLVYESREENYSEELLISIHQVLSKLAPKDRKFGVKARLTGALGVTLNLLKTHNTTTKILQPLLPVIKHYSNNAVNASYLGKNGAISCLYKVLSTCGRKHLTSLKYAVDSLALLVKSKSNSARAIGQGGVPVLLNMFFDWHKVDSKNRHVTLRKSILNVLKNLTNLKSGRDSLKAADGIRILYTTCHESIDSRELETLIFMASVIMRKCFPRNRLPVASLRSAVQCPLPDSDFHVIDMGEGTDGSAPSEIERTPVSRIDVRMPRTAYHSNQTYNPCNYPSNLINPYPTSNTNNASTTNSKTNTSQNTKQQSKQQNGVCLHTNNSTSPTRRSNTQTHKATSNHAQNHVTSSNHVTSGQDENGYESSLDHDDDLSSDDDAEVHRVDSDDELERDLRQQAAQRRTWDDLMQYKKFFPELYEFDIEEDDIYQGNHPFVPQHDQQPAGVRASHSTGYLDTMLSRQNSYTRGAANANTRGVVSALPRRRGGAAGAGADSEMDTHHSGANSAREPQLARGLSRIGMYSPSDPYLTTSPSPSAVNLKTGSSVFSLDFPPSSKNSSEKPPATKISKRRKGTTRTLTNGSNETGRRKGRTRTSIGNRSDEGILGETGRSVDNGSFSVTSSIMTSRSEKPPFLLGSDDEASNENDDEFVTKVNDPEIYTHIASKTNSVGRFNKIAYPDLYGHTPPPIKEPLYEKVFGTQRQKIFEDIDRFIHTDQTLDRVVYDLDSVVRAAGPTYTTHYSSHSNQDEIKISKEEGVYESLRFNAQFESGNLRKAIQVRQYEYDLILSPDVNTNHHHQWFYFQVSNMEANVKYRFNIVNCEKLNSQFNFGMKPVMFSVTEAIQGRPHWTRVGSEICYYKNHYVRSAQTTGGVRGKSYYTATFTISFRHQNDVCYMAYHYPYTYSTLQYHIYKWEERIDSSQIYFCNQSLTTTLGGNSVPVLTITSQPLSADAEGVEQLKSRQYIFLSGRVHPGESNASWVMKGTIDYLLSDKAAAKSLRDQYIFKIVPMLNPDGVINGTHRCSLVAEDLNRRWIAPCPKLHPTIHHTKGLLQFLNAMQRVPLVYCDYHGHSRRKNVFIYGCSPSLSWMQEDLDNPAVIGNRMEDTSYKTLPKILQSVAPAFSLQNCSFMVEKAKEPSARVVVWRQIRVVKSYTMESTYCGCDQGIYRGLHISTRELVEMGRKFGEALNKLKSRNTKPVKLSSSGNTLDMAALDAQTDIASNAQADNEADFGEAAAGVMDPLALHSDASDSDADDDNDVEDDDDALDEAAAFT